MAKVAGGGPRLPDELMVWEILTRLPAKPLLRCRAVCRSWHRILTSDAKFLHAHHRRQPSLRLVTTSDRSSQERRIDALDHRTGERRPVARTTGGAGGAKDDIHVLASCDGLLALLAYGGLEICNPATRQRAPLTLLHGVAGISGLYPHRPTGSYRLLVWFKKDGRAVFKVHTVGSSEVRCIGDPPGPWASGDICKDIAMMEWLYPNVLVDDRLYWQPAKLLGGNSKSKGMFNDMLVFDTMAESFQHKLSPVEGGGFHELFEMNTGALGLYETRGDRTDLWVLQDYKSWAWSLNHRIKLPVEAICVLPVLDPEGDVLVLSVKGESSFEQRHLQHISGANGSLLARYEWNDSMDLKRHRFKESLVHHDFFMEGNVGSMVEQPLFDGMSTVALVRDANSEPH